MSFVISGWSIKIVNKTIMYGSLSEFIDVQKKFRIQQIPRKGASVEQPLRSLSNDKKNRHKSLLIYQTLDKSIYLKSELNREKQIQQERRILLRQAIKQEVEPKRSQSEGMHWVQKKMSKASVKPKHKLLKAVILTKQLEGQDNYKTLYDKSLGRIISAYSKIKTQPIDSLLPPKIVEASNQLPKQEQHVSPSRSSTISASKLISLQDAVKWAKKHGKKVNNFYQQMGKSFELINKQKPGKNNYQLQKQSNQVKEEQNRRSIRRKFLKQIERRISKYGANPATK